MPKEILTINDLSKGINSDLSPNDISDNQVVNAINFLLDKNGKIRPINGFSQYGISGFNLDEENEPWIYNQLNGFGAISFRLDYNAYGTRQNSDWIAFQHEINKIIIFDVKYPLLYFKYTLENGLYNFFFHNGFLYINNKNFSVNSPLRKWGYFSNTHFKGMSRNNFDDTGTINYEYSSSGFSLIEANSVDFNFISLPHSLMEGSEKAYCIINGALIEAKNPGPQYNDYKLVFNFIIPQQNQSCYLSEKNIIFDINFNGISTVAHPLSNTIPGTQSFKSWFNTYATQYVKNIIEVKELKNLYSDKFDNVDNLSDIKLSGIDFKNGESYIYDVDGDGTLANNIYDDWTMLSPAMQNQINAVDFLDSSYPTRVFELKQISHDAYDLFFGTSNELTETKFENTVIFESSTGSGYGIVSENNISFSNANGNIILNNSLTSHNSSIYFHANPNNGVSVLLLYKKIINTENPFIEGRYQFIATYLFKDETESAPIFSNLLTQIEKNESLQINIKLAFNNTYKYNLNAVGIKFYIKNLETSDVFYIGYLDFNNGFKTHSRNDYLPLIPYCELDSNNQKVIELDDNHAIKTGFINIERPISKTFKYETGFDIDDNVNTRFKKAVIANSRLFCVNVKHDEEFPDRMVISPVNRPSILPKNNFIEIVSNDGDEYITISKFGSKILAFKRNYLYIINISSNDPSTFYLEASKFGAGCEYEDAVVSTEFGVFWINSNGIYFYDGETVINLALNRIENKIRQLLTNAKMMTAGYDYIYKKVLFLIKNTSNNSTVFVYDVKNNGFVNITRELSYPLPNDSNFISINGNCCILNPFYIAKYDESSYLSKERILETKKYDFGQPHVRKKIRRFYAHFIGNINLDNITFEYRIDDNEYQTITSELQVSGNLILFDLPSSVTCYTVQLKITGNVTFEINDISIIYRRKLPK